MRKLLLVLIAVLVLAGLGTAQGFITTTFVSNNGGSANWMNMFILKVDQPGGINVTSLAVNCSGTVKTTFSIDVYTIPTTYKGSEFKASAWKKVTTGSALVQTHDTPSPVDVADFLLAQGQYGIAIHYINTGMGYTNGSGTKPNSLFVSNDKQVLLQAGISITSLFGGSQFIPRVWNGTIWYSPGASAVLTGSGKGAPGTTYDFSMVAANEPKAPYKLATSFGKGPIPIDTRKLELSLDALLILSVQGVLPTVFENYSGLLDTSGRASAKLNIPNIPAIKGLTINSAFIILKPASPSGVNDISNTADFKIS